jgi:hypothetical protein
MLATWTDSIFGGTSTVMPFTSESPAPAKTLRDLVAFMDDVSFANCIDQRVQDEIEVTHHFNIRFVCNSLIKRSRLN